MKQQIILVLTVLLELCTAAKILFIIPMPARSHYNLGDRLIEELVKRGHEVTIISTFKKPTPIKNLTEIVIPMYDWAFPGKNEPGGKFNLRNMSPLSFLMFSSFGEVLVENTMKAESVQNFMKSNQKFDLVVGEAFLMEGMLAGFAHKYKAPMAAIATFIPNTWSNELVGNPAASSYIPEPILSFSDKMNFYERMINFLYSTLSQFVHYMRQLPIQERMMKKYFGNDLPPLKDTIKKTSLVLVNHHHVLAFPRPYLPNMVEVGGFHVKPPKPLPPNIEKFMNEAKDGIIFFSMGSNLESSDFLPETLNGILKIFSKLKQRVLWKFEAEDVKNIPPNVMVSKWLPQSDILAHPNMKLFITHGGLLSLTESVLRGVPVIGIPIFGDQPLNMKQVEKLQIGVQIQYEDIGTDVMFESILEVLNNPKYTKNMKYRSQLLQDLPMSPLDTAVYWLEYVIRYKGAPHIMSGAQDLAWYQLYLLDVFAVFGLVLLVSTFVGITCLKCMFRTLCGGKKNNVPPSKKRN